MRTFWFTSGIALIAGACVPLALAPFHLWPLMIIGIAGFYWLSVAATGPKQAAWYGWLYGCSFFGIGVSWIYGSMQTVDTPVWLSLLLTGGFCLLMALFHLYQNWFFYRFFKPLRAAWLVAAPLWWVVNEWLREWVLTGMPWLYAGYAFSDLPVAQLAAVVGIYGLSLVMAIVSALLFEALRNLAGKPLRAAVLVSSSVLILISANLVGWLTPASSWTESLRTLSVAAVQSNVDQRSKWTIEQQRPTLEFYAASFQKMMDVELVLWPEAAMTQLPEQIPYFLSQIDDIAKQRDQALITGIVTEENGHYFNTMLGFGTASGSYRKQHLVPFGEYVPLQKYLRGLIDFFNLPSSIMHPAIKPQLPLSFVVDNEHYFTAGIICYEAAYPNLVKRLAKESNVLAVVSNDAWFGDSIGPHQHLQITQMRAIENGRAMIRATQNGISALVDANGNILQQSAQFVPAELFGELTLRTGLTPFQQLPAHVLIYLCLCILALLLLINKIRRKPAQLILKD